MGFGYVTEKFGTYSHDQVQSLVPIQKVFSLFDGNVWPRMKTFYLFNPLSPNSTQNQFSPNDIHRLSWAKSIRINKTNTKRKMFDLVPNSRN